MSALSEALNEANVNGWSSREIARLAGDRVHHATISKFMNGKHSTNPGDDVLAALAEVFGIPLTRLRELAGRPAGGVDPYVPPPEASLLDPRQRRAVDEVIRSMVTGSSVLPDYLVGVFDSMTQSETVQFLRDFQGTTRDRLDALWRQRKRWVESGGLPAWDAGTPDTPEYREARAAYEEHVFALTPESNKGRPVETWEDPERFEPDLATVLEIARQREEAERPTGRQEAARKGKANLRDVKRLQDEAGEAPDPEGPEGGA